MNLEKLGPGEVPEKIHAVIEIPAHSRMKYEYDKEIGAIFADRALYSSVNYPANYGFVPQTLSLDGDPADIFVISEHDLMPGIVIKCRLIGALVTEDESGLDEKYIAVPVAKIDPMYADVNSLEDLPQITRDRIKEFFETYKNLEPNKWVKVTDWLDKDQAADVLGKAVERFNEK